MAYGYFTDKYSFPAQVKGNTMSEREEKRKARIIDNNLYAALVLHSAGYGVISEGTYSGTFSANNSRVDLTALEALINQIYVSPTSTVSWTGIPNNVTFYLYVTLVEQATETSPAGASSKEYKNVQATTNTNGIIPANSILLATATTTASVITVVTNPTGKRRIKTVADHDLHGSGVDAYNDSTFRGDVSIQDTLTVEDPSTFQQLVTFEKDIKLNGGIESGLSIYGADTIVRDDLVVQKTATVNDDTTLEYLQVRSGEDIYGNSTFRNNLTLQGAVFEEQVTVNNTYTARAADNTILCSGTGFFVAVPTAVGRKGKRYTWKNIGGGLIRLSGIELLDGDSVKDISQYGSLTIESDNTQWWII